MKKLRITRIIVVCTYIVVFFAAVSFVYMIPSLFEQTERTYIDNANESVYMALQSNTVEEVKEKLDQAIIDYPMELVVFSGEQVVYNTTALTDPTTTLLQNNVNKNVVLIEKQEPVTSNLSNDITIWYALYQMPAGQSIINFYFIWILIFVLVLFAILLGSIVYIQIYFYKPLDNLKDSLSKVESNNFDDVEATNDDVINIRFKQFANRVGRFSKNVLNDYTLLERDLETARENLDANILYTKAFVHDLKTPVHEMLMENEFELLYGNNKENELLQFNVKQSDEMLHKLNKILQVLNKGLTQEQIEITRIDIVDIVAKEKQAFITSLKQKKLLITIDQPEKLELMTNKVSFTLLIHNILSNAVKYAISGSEIILELYEDNGEYKIICKNETDPVNIKRIENSTEFFNVYSEPTNEQEHMYSSGNGLYLIAELSHVLGGEYELIIDDTEIITIVHLRGWLDDQD